MVNVSYLNEVSNGVFYKGISYKLKLHVSTYAHAVCMRIAKIFRGRLIRYILLEISNGWTKFF